MVAYFAFYEEGEFDDMPCQVLDYRNELPSTLI